MSGNNELKKLIFESYNGMSRPAMFWSIPIMPMIGLLMGGVFSGIAGVSLLSWVWGLAFLFPFLAALVVLHFLCAIDGQYLRRVRFAGRRLKLNLKYGKPLLLTPFNPHWSEFYGSRFSQKRYATGSESADHAVRGARQYDHLAGQPPGEPGPS